MARQAKVQVPPGRKAILLFTLLLLLLLVGAAIRFFDVQVLQADDLELRAKSQRTAQITTPAQRGTIYDREGNVLAQSVQVYNVIGDPLNVKHKATVAQRIAHYFKGDVAVYTKLLSRNSHYAMLVRKVDPKTVAAFKAASKSNESDTEAEAALKKEMRTVSFELDYKRAYPSGTVAAQTVGFVNAESEGVAGLELEYNSILKGTPGVTFSERDQAGNPIPAGVQKEIAAKPGRDIMLTIDSQISHYAQQRLDSAVESSESTAGAIVVMNPRNGEIYAALSSPSFNPNHLDKTTNDAISNRALVGLYEPGSTFKIVTLASALEHGTVNPNTTFNVPYSIRIGTHTVSDSHVHPTQTMSVREIIRQSSNVGTTRIATALGQRNFYDTLVDFGLSKDPGVDFPGSHKGILPKKGSWSKILLSNASFGQGVSLTPISLARCVAVPANDGVMVTPHLLADIPSDAEAVPNWKSQDKQVISEDTAHTETNILEGVMEEGGTGQTVKVPGYRVAGKTGTAQVARPGKGYVDGLYVSSFVGYLPTDDPQLLVLAVLYEPKRGYYGADVAGPVFEDVAKYAAAQLNITPSTKRASRADKGTGTVSGKGTGTAVKNEGNTP